MDDMEEWNQRKSELEAKHLHSKPKDATKLTVEKRIGLTNQQQKELLHGSN